MPRVKTHFGLMKAFIRAHRCMPTIDLASACWHGMMNRAKYELGEPNVHDYLEAKKVDKPVATLQAMHLGVRSNAFALTVPKGIIQKTLRIYIYASASATLCLAGPHGQRA